MVSIVADNQAVERCLERILELARRGGAEFADALILRGINGSLSIELPPDSDAQALIKLPENILVPVGLFGFTLEGDDIAVRTAEPGVTAEQRALLESMVELYNLTGKIAWYRQTSPVLFLGSQPDLARLIARGRDEPMRQGLERLATGGYAESIVLQRFIGSRWFRFREDGEEAEKRVLMPILDLMNHHVQGSAFDKRSDGGGRYLCIERARSMPREVRECFVCYARYDAMEMLLAYNFVDETATFVRSVPMEINLPDVGVIKVQTSKKKGFNKNLPPQLQDIAAFLPKIIAKRADHLEVTFLSIPATVTPQVFRRVLNVLIGTLNRTCMDRLDLILQAEEQVIAANRAYYRTVQEALRAVPAEDQAGAAWQDLARACDLQLSLLQRYSDMARALAA
ncbi:MAG TPA: hypothetical protein VMQ73_18970 [Methylomirabilota bacterium]|nr:hypothetical protein [Methylomirabilota bacterium]